MKFRKYISAPGLLSVLGSRFERIPDSRDQRRVVYSLRDTLMAATAMFSLKYPSLLQFDEEVRGQDQRKQNLRNVYSIEKVPSDTQMRAIIDPVEPDQIHKAFKDIIAHLQQGKILDAFKSIDGSLLVAADGTGLFSSTSVHCENCCEKESRNGSKTYYHQAFSFVVVSPNIPNVIPICMEPISKQDGSNKNDCEMNAAKRALEKLRREHPHFKMRLVLDGLFSKGPMIQQVHSLNLGYIVIAKESDHAALFEHFTMAKEIGDAQTFTQTVNLGKSQIQQEYFYCNDVPLNDSYKETLVNILEYRETINAKTTRWVWITDLRLNKANVEGVMRGGRARWRIENETFNVLKNHGYEFEHNFGHGTKNLCTNLYFIMMLAFLIDQVQEMSCEVFGKLLGLAKRRMYLWEKMRSIFSLIPCENFSDFYEKIGKYYEDNFAIDTG